MNDQHLPRRIEKAIGLSVPRDIRMEAVNDMYLELLDGKLRADQIESAAPRFRSKAYQMTCNNYSPRGLEEENEDGFSWLTSSQTLTGKRLLTGFWHARSRTTTDDEVGATG